MKILKLAFMFLICTCLASSCDSFKDSNDYTAEELEKNLDGSWYILKAERNGADITRLMDFSKFRLAFKSDKTYKIDNYLPFLVRENGEWSVNDPQYPSQLNFKIGESSEEKQSAFQYLIVKGERQLILTFTPGYLSNSYTYTFKREVDSNK